MSYNFISRLNIPYIFSTIIKGDKKEFPPKFVLDFWDPTIGRKLRLLERINTGVHRFPLGGGGGGRLKRSEQTALYKAKPERWKEHRNLC